jgi:hypothetical protein
MLPSIKKAASRLGGLRFRSHAEGHLLLHDFRNSCQSHQDWGENVTTPLPSRAEVNNSGATPPLPYVSSSHSAYIIKHRNNFTLLRLCLKLCNLHFRFYTFNLNVYKSTSTEYFNLRQVQKILLYPEALRQAPQANHHPNKYVTWTISPGVMRSGREAYHSPLSNEAQGQLTLRLRPFNVI